MGLEGPMWSERPSEISSPVATAMAHHPQLHSETVEETDEFTHHRALPPIVLGKDLLEQAMEKANTEIREPDRYASPKIASQEQQQEQPQEETLLQSAERHFGEAAEAIKSGVQKFGAVASDTAQGWAEGTQNVAKATFNKAQDLANEAQCALSHAADEAGKTLEVAKETCESALEHLKQGTESLGNSVVQKAHEVMGSMVAADNACEDSETCCIRADMPHAAMPHEMHDKTCELTESQQKGYGTFKGEDRSDDFKQEAQEEFPPLPSSNSPRNMKQERPIQMEKSWVDAVKTRVEN